MVWKRVLLVGLGLAMVLPMSIPAAAEEVDPEAGPNFTGQVYPYGTKAGGVFFSPGMHGLGLVYQIVVHQPGKAFTLSAEFPVNGVYPDFDMIAVNAADIPIQTWNTLGGESGTVPSTTAYLYVYMPIGPDLPEDPAKGTFRFSQP